MIGGLEKLDATGRRYPVETGSKLAVVITSQILGSLPIRGSFSKRYGPTQASVGDRVTPMWTTLRDCSSMTNNACERSKEQIGDLEARHTPRSGWRGCAKRSPTSGMVDGFCEHSSCTSGWFAYTHAFPVSTIPRECAQHPKADSLSPSS